MNPDWILLPTLAVIAAGYALVGHGGASGFLAVLALWGFSSPIIKTSSLLLNLLVGLLAVSQFALAARIQWSLVWPFVMTSVPLAWVGGSLALPGVWYKALLGLFLLLSAGRLFLPDTPEKAAASGRSLPLILALPTGGLIGMVAGSIGVGGGVFLSPLLILARWTDARGAAGVTSVFTVVNSAGALIGNVYSGNTVLAPGILSWVAAALLGGFAGSRLGSRHIKNQTLKKVLAVILALAGLRLFVQVF